MFSLLNLKATLPRSLFGRSLLILVTPVLLVQVFTSFMFFERHWGRIADRLAFAVAGEIAVIAERRMADGMTPEGWAQITGFAARKLDLLISYEEGDALESAAEPPPSLARPLSEALSDKVRRPFRIIQGQEEKWIEVGVQLPDGVLHVSVPQGRLFSSSGRIFLLWMIGSGIVLTVVAILFMRNQIRPIRRLAVAAERLGRGLPAPAAFKPEGAREVRQAAQAFLDMHERIRRQVAQRTAMLAGVSHDLRTPLTRMKLQAAMMGDSPDARALRSDIGDMERMIGAYLDFARGDNEAEQTVSTDLNLLLGKIAGDALRDRAGLHFEPEEELIASLKPVAFERCMNNIIGNAQKYAETIWVEARRVDGYVEITVDDDGPGIPDHQLGDVFRPFVRGEPSRNPETGGVGLGLSVAQDVIHAHGGTIELGRSVYGGLCVTIRIP